VPAVPAWTQRTTVNVTRVVVEVASRRRGVATAALKAALLAVARRGGGVVEAFPVVRWEVYQNNALPTATPSKSIRSGRVERRNAF